MFLFVRVIGFSPRFFATLLLPPKSRWYLGPAGVAFNVLSSSAAAAAVLTRGRAPRR